jgi:hypothetical protein
MIIGDIMATEPTEKYGKKQYPFENIFVSLRGFRGYQRNTDTRLDLSTSVIFKLIMH